MQKIRHFLSTLRELVFRRGDHRPSVDTKQKIIVINGDNNTINFKDDNDLHKS